MSSSSLLRKLHIAKKIEEAISVALHVETFSENNVLHSNFPFLGDL
jgi:hypothetical protein